MRHSANGHLDRPHNSRKRARFEAPPLVRARGVVPYAELHCHSNFSFLDGASHPEELVLEAARLGLDAVAITDHDGLYGVVRFAVAAGEVGIPTVYGAELSLDLPSGQTGIPDPVGSHLVVLARGQEGYHRLAAVLGDAHLAGGQKGRPVYDLEDAAARLAGEVVVLTGCRKGTVPAALALHGVDAARGELDRLTALFGADSVAVELVDHGDPRDRDRNDALADLAKSTGLPVVATNNVHYHAPRRRRLATVVAAVRARSSLDDLDPWLPAAGTAHLRSGAEMAARMALYPTAVPTAARLAAECAFDLRLIAPRLPPFDVPDGHTEASWLRELTDSGATARYGPRQAHPQAWAQIDHELALIEQLDFPGYFLVVWDITRFCRQQDIYCQGRGSAANSAVCYALRITNVDSVAHGLLFERFLAPERDGPPDIDVDIESDRREEVIQYVYRKHGRRHTAQVANVISYRPRSAVRDVARAFGFSPGQQDAWSKQLDRWHDLSPDTVEGIPEPVVEHASALLTAPRHLGIHSGGMVICHRPVTEVVPVERARMPGRTVLQWDKDDCAEIGLTKFDLLGLGMLSALHYAVDFLGFHLDLGDLDCSDPQVYDDLVVEVALIRPGPIQGGSVHPYIRRKNGLDQPIYGHPLMRPALEKTLGVPLFQEQMMQLAIDCAGFSPSEADQLRRAMGSKRSSERMERLKDRLYEGMAANGIPSDVCDDIYLKLAAFANYGFPESHAMSFAYLVYVSAWLKRYHPAAFTAALLGAQPMGFYSLQSLVDDARRHGVEVRRPDINASGVKATLESTPDTHWGAQPSTPPHTWGCNGPAVRLGLDQVRTITTDTATRIVTAHDADGPYTSLTDLARRADLSTHQLEALATADAFAGLGLSRRQALWAAGAAALDKPDRLPDTVPVSAPMLPGMDAVDRLVADVWATGLSPTDHPIRLVRAHLDAVGAIRIDQLSQVPDKTRILVGGLVTHRQRPATARGVTFLNLEDETGMLNVVVSEGAWNRYRKLLRNSPALLVRGRLEAASGVINLVADQIQSLPIAATLTSRDFR
ncbi:error-prone DNA polymerase [Phytohabitans sp. ZYX-F-186]|uniref:Error-prone DNA polymerase n=2 Tax=Phytohabitans maris TaxID=3071409 RepID=A0ABU0ZKQ8_9ACTN|nr:error-prone DNA polymerase [Phytohabitans sp. ZYX-F-186]MDQ7907633.1 error-prone DNA polymerase [Phytohabitans sp. ZYX-F-186]